MSKNENPETEPESHRPVDIEDQGHGTETGKDTNPSAPSEEEKDKPGPVGVAVREATQKAGEAPTTIIEQTSHLGT